MSLAPTREKVYDFGRDPRLQVCAHGLEAEQV
jgi:hypothetical protein